MRGLFSSVLVTVFVTPHVVFASEKPVLKTTITVTREMVRENGPNTIFKTVRANRRTQEALIRPDEVVSQVNEETTLPNSELELVTSKLGYLTGDPYASGRQRLLVRTDLKTQVIIPENELARFRTEGMEALRSAADARYKALTGLTGKAQLKQSELSCLLVERAMECSETIQITVR